MKKGQVITYKNKRRGIGYGVIIHSTENSISFVEVDRATEFTKCYDEPGAKYPEDKDNVRLKDYPSPFKTLSNRREGAIYALADIDNPIVFTKEQCEKYQVTVIDKEVSKRDMHEIFHHPWIDEIQKQKIMERRKGININIICDDEEKEDDMEY